MQAIESNPQLNWNWQLVSRNPNLTMEFIESYPNIDWNWSYMSGNRFKK